MNHIVFFEIQSSRPERDIAFYQSVFDWTFERQPGLPIEYYMITTEGIDGALLQRPTKTPPAKFGTNAYACVVEINDFEASAKKILDNGGRIALAKFAIPGYAWQGYFIDPDNNVFGIRQLDQKAG
jgi:uncharacterized protein